MMRRRRPPSRRLASRVADPGLGGLALRLGLPQLPQAGREFKRGLPGAGDGGALLLPAAGRNPIGSAVPYVRHVRQGPRCQPRSGAHEHRARALFVAWLPHAGCRRQRCSGPRHPAAPARSHPRCVATSWRRRAPSRTCRQRSPARTVTQIVDSGSLHPALRPPAVDTRLGDPSRQAARRSYSRHRRDSLTGVA